MCTLFLGTAVGEGGWGKRNSPPMWARVSRMFGEVRGVGALNGHCERVSSIVTESGSWC